MATGWFIVLTFGLVLLIQGKEISIIEQTLQFVELARTNCTDGNSVTLPTTFSASKWLPAAQVAVRSSNLLTGMFIANMTITDGLLLHLTFTDVQSQPLIYGSWIGFEVGVFHGDSYFNPYTYRDNGTIVREDYTDYDYRAPDIEWYCLSRNRSWNHIQFKEIATDIRYASETGPTRVPVVELSDGSWTRPYYDCGGGDIWMISFTLPFFNVVNNTPVFIGAAGVDIDLSDIDINQCDSENGGNSDTIALFLGSHHCHPTTKCYFTPGMGFRRGAYECRCHEGFYQPRGKDKVFEGGEVESYRDNHDEDPSGSSSPFQCIPCEEGCSKCVDASPCTHMPNWIVRGAVLAVDAACVLLVIILAILIVVFKEKASFRSGSPLFLITMCIGGVIKLSKMFVLFFHALSVQCVIAAWFDVIGFAVLFGSLLLKTWRIAALCTVKTARTNAISDIALLRRLIPILVCAAGMAGAWTGIAPEKPQLLYDRVGLKFMSCGFSWLQLAAQLAATGFLIWGAYLCFRVRKAPSAFNESRYITWAIYNAALTGNFLFASIYFLATQEGPDVLFVLEFIRVIIEALGTILIIIIPKVILMNKEVTATKNLATQAARKTAVSVISELKVPNKILKSVTTQTETVDTSIAAGSQI